MENTQPLDPRLNATEITELANLNTQEVTIKIPKITRSDADSMVVSSEHIIFEEMDYANVPMTAAFCVGDCVLKVNNDAPQSDAHFKQILADLSPCTVVVSRRSFVIAPGELRLRKSLIAMNLPYQKGFSYQVVCCKKQSWDRFLTTSFGFLAEDVVVGPGSNKFIIGEINTNTAAEKYFSVGDGLIDFKGTAIKPGKDPNGLKQFNATFQQGGDDMEVLIERPVSKDARNLTEGYIKKHLLRHDTPAMSDDAINIGINAALYHHMFWRRLTSVSILVKPPPIAATPAPTKKKKVGKTRRITKTRTKEDATAIEGTNDGDGDGGLRITLEAKKNFQEISTDVADGTELETVGYRYSSEGEDDDEKEDKEDDDDTEKKKSPSKSPAKKPAAPAAPAAVAAAPAAAPAAGAKKADSKRKRGLFSSLPFIRLKK